ncbi:DivIVA domain-containing protein [Enterococcus gilvus]|uniref:DivIVA domain-containing protein n=1 Tax=Enterococcus gilvus TaxID=160453 RepID=UPI00345EC136
MELTAEKLERLTFPTSSVGGYRKQDVDDFLNLVAREYKKNETALEELKQKEWQQSKEIAQVKDFYLKRESDYLVEIKRQLQEIDQLKVAQAQIVPNEAPVEKTSFQQAIMIAQDTAFEIEQQAEEEKQRILEQAEFDRGHMIKDARTQSNELMEQAKRTQEEMIEEAERIKQNAQRHAEATEAHTQKVLQELSMKRQQEEQQAKSELSKLEYKKQALQQDIRANRQEELTFLESQIYEYKLLLHRLEKQNWQQLADKLTQQLQKI